MLISFKNLRSNIGKLFTVNQQISIVRFLSKFFWSLREYFLGVKIEYDDFFKENLKLVYKNSCLDKERLWNIYNFTKIHNRIFKDCKTYAVEFGVAKAASFICLANFLNQKTSLIGIDQFGEKNKKMIFNSKYDDHYKDFDPFGKKGLFKHVNKDSIKSYIKKNTKRNVKLISGIFPSELERKDEVFLKQLKFSFVHIDFDLYDSTIQAINFVFPRLKNNGFLIIDDYGMINQSGVKKACEDSLLDLNKTFLTSSGQLIYIHFN